MAIYDVESFLTEIETVFKANLNTEITAINTEKGDSLITTISDNAWYVNQLPEVHSYPVFIVWGLSNISYEDATNENAIELHEISFEVVLPDEGEQISKGSFLKLLRYVRAFKSVANKNYDKFRGIAKLKVNSLTPLSFVVEGRRYIHAGISVTASFSTN